jgi:hypothetical protein
MATPLLVAQGIHKVHSSLLGCEPAQGCFGGFDCSDETGRQVTRRNTTSEPVSVPARGKAQSAGDRAAATLSSQ